MKGLYSHPEEKGLYGIFNDSFPPILDGVTLTVENYARWLQESGHTPCVVTPWNPVRQECAYSVMKYFSLPIRSRRPYRYGYPKLDPFIWSRLHKTDFRIVHCHCPFSSGRLGVYVKKTQGVPLIGTFHSKYRTDLQHSLRRMPWLVPIIMNRIISFFNSCDEVWIPQAQVEETVREYGYKGPLTVVENGNDFADIAGSDTLFDYKREAKRRMGFDEESLNLLFVGQHIWEKGVKVIIEALAKLKGKVAFNMNFVGTGFAAGELAELVRQERLENCVRLNGVVSDRKKLSDFYAASDLFLFPSFYDNAPLVLREAAAMGTPAILLEGSTASEMIRDGHNGFLTQRTPGHFAARIEQLWHDRALLRRSSLEARNTLVRSWQDVVGEVIDRYDVIIRRHQSK